MHNPSTAVQTRHQTLPRTGRGRALYTVDRFASGIARLHDHDDPRLQLRGSHAQ